MKQPGSDRLHPLRHSDQSDSFTPGLRASLPICHKRAMVRTFRDCVLGRGHRYPMNDPAGCARSFALNLPNRVAP
jgi:hypothetical protein